MFLQLCFCCAGFRRTSPPLRGSALPQLRDCDLGRFLEPRVHTSHHWALCCRHLRAYGSAAAPPPAMAALLPPEKTHGVKALESQPWLPSMRYVYTGSRTTPNTLEAARHQPPPARPRTGKHHPSDRPLARPGTACRPPLAHPTGLPHARPHSLAHQQPPAARPAGRPLTHLSCQPPSRPPRTEVQPRRPTLP